MKSGLLTNFLGLAVRRTLILIIKNNLLNSITQRNKSKEIDLL